MPYAYEIRDTPPICVLLRGTGRVELAAFVSTLRSLQAEPRFAPELPLLLDWRDVDGMPPVRSGVTFGETWRQVVPSHRIAIVARPATATFGLARQVSAFAGDRVEVFTSIEEAHMWLEGLAPAY